MKSNFFISTAAFILCLVSLVSCDQEIDEQIMDTSTASKLEEDFEIVLEMMQEDPALALDKCDQLIKQSEKLNSVYHSGKAKWYKAYLYDEILQDVSQAYFYYNEAIKDLEKTDSSSIKMSVYTNLGLLYRFYGQYNAALSSYEAALALKKDLSPKQLSDLYYNYGVSLKLKGDESSFSKAEVMFTKSLEYAKQIDDHNNIASVNNQIGLMYKAIGDYDMSRIAYKNTIRAYESEDKMSEYVGKAYHGIGVTYLDQKQLNKASTSFQKALEFKQKSSSVFVTLYDLGKVYHLKGETGLAIDTWKKALKEEHDLNNIEQLQVYVKLSGSLSEKGKHEEALSYNEIFNKHMVMLVNEGQKYKLKNNQVLFADVIREYEEFYRPVPWFKNLWVVTSLSVAVFFLLYVLLIVYYKRRTSEEVTRTVSRIQSEFQHIMVD